MITATFARYAAELTYEKLPEETKLAARKVLMDWLGNIYSGVTTPTGQIVHDLVVEAGGTPRRASSDLAARAQR